MLMIIMKHPGLYYKFSLIFYSISIVPRWVLMSLYSLLWLVLWLFLLLCYNHGLHNKIIIIRKSCRWRNLISGSCLFFYFILKENQTLVWGCLHCRIFVQWIVSKIFGIFLGFKMHSMLFTCLLQFENGEV